MGPIPAEVQPGFMFSGALTTGAKDTEGGAALLRFLASREAAPAISKAGLAPVNR